MHVNDHGAYRWVAGPHLVEGGYSTMRLWVNRNTNRSYLLWSLYVMPSVDGDTDFSGDVRVDVRRLEVDKAGCTTNQVGGVATPGVTFMPWVAFEGDISNYTITNGNF